MNNYIKFNENRWNNVKNDYTEPLTHEELEEARKHPISVALTVGKKVPQEWFEKANEKKIENCIKCNRQCTLKNSLKYRS